MYVFTFVYIHRNHFVSCQHTLGYPWPDWNFRQRWNRRMGRPRDEKSITNDTEFLLLPLQVNVSIHFFHLGVHYQGSFRSYLYLLRPISCHFSQYLKKTKLKKNSQNEVSRLYWKETFRFGLDKVALGGKFTFEGKSFFLNELELVRRRSCISTGSTQQCMVQ